MRYTASDEVKRRGVRRMKTIATGFLVVATVVYALASWAHSAGTELFGSTAWSGYVQAGAEAGMVGALADWFAVTANQSASAPTIPASAAAWTYPAHDPAPALIAQLVSP